MSRYYLRQWSIDLGDEAFIEATNIQQFKMTFNVIREFGGNVSYADIALYNLSESTANKAIKQGLEIVLRAGYQDTIDNIFEGKIINIFRERQQADTITRMICRGGKQSTDKTVSKPFGKEATLAPIIRECVTAMGYAISINDDDFADLQPFPRGYMLHGDPVVMLRKLADMHRFKWVIENDTVVIIGFEKYRQGDPIKISEFTGMVGIPQITVEGCDVKTKLNPAIRIGARIDIQSEFKSFNFGDMYFREIPPSAGTGVYKVMKIVHQGDSHGDDWTTAITSFRVGN